MEEQKKKLLSLIAQRNKNFERMISMGKEHGNMSGLGYNSNDSTTYSTKNTFIKTKEKPHALPQVTQQQSNTYVGKTFSSFKEKDSENFLGQISFQRQRNFEKRETSFSKGNTKDTHYGSSLKSKAFHGNQSTSTKRIFNNYGRRHDWKNQNTSHNNKNSIYKEKKRENRSYTTYASISRKPSPICYYCGHKGHMKVDCKKRLNDVKSSRFQKKSQNERKARKRSYFQKVENENLEHKKRLYNLTQSKVKKEWVKKDDLKCLVIHTTLRAGKTSRWYLDSGCSKHMTGEKSLFTHLAEAHDGRVTFGDGNSTRIVEKGTIEVPRILKLNNVLYVEGLRHNLISISQICDKRYDVHFAKHK